MSTQYAQSADGTRIAYDRWGAGPAIVLVHGGGSRRQEWQEAGYIQLNHHVGFFKNMI